MMQIHEGFMEEIEEIIDSNPYVPNRAKEIQQPPFEYEVAADHLYVFKSYKGRDIMLRMRYVSPYNMFAVAIEEFYTGSGIKHGPADFGEQFGMFTPYGRQLPHKIKVKRFKSVESKLLYAANVTDANIKGNYFPLIKKAINFYTQAFLQ